VVLEKAAVKGKNVFYTLCGDIPEMKDGNGKSVVNGGVTGRLAAAFHTRILSAASEHGADKLYDIARTPSPDGGPVLAGEGVCFGSGCAGILAVSESAYVWTSENSGMCVIRISEVLGKRRIIRCVSSEVGGEEPVGLAPGTILIACPETWAAGAEETLRALLDAFVSGEIRDDVYFDRVLGEVAGESFEGCMSVLAVKGP